MYIFIYIHTSIEYRISNFGNGETPPLKKGGKAQQKEGTNKHTNSGTHSLPIQHKIP